MKLRLRSLLQERQGFYERSFHSTSISTFSHDQGDARYSRVEDAVVELIEWEEKIGVDISQEEKDDRQADLDAEF